MGLMCFHRSSNQGSGSWCWYLFFFYHRVHRTHALLQVKGLHFEKRKIEMQTVRYSLTSYIVQYQVASSILCFPSHSSSSSSSSPSEREAQGRIWRYLSNHFSTIWVTRGWLRRRELFCMAASMPPSVTQQSSHSLSSFSCCSSLPI